MCAYDDVLQAIVYVANKSIPHSNAIYDTLLEFVEGFSNRLTSDLTKTACSDANGLEFLVDTWYWFSTVCDV